MKNRFNAFFIGFNVLCLAWLSYDFIAFGLLRSKMQHAEPLAPADAFLGTVLWIGLAVFLLFHIVSFIFIAGQIKYFKKAPPVSSH